MIRRCCRLKRCCALVTWTLLAGVAHGQTVTEVLYRSNVGVVDDSGNVALKLDFRATPAEQTYDLEVPAGKLLPVAGRWQADTTESVGVYSRATGTFYLRIAQTSGPATLSFPFFFWAPLNSDSYPLMGDWDGDGIDTAGLYNRNTATAYLKNENSASAPIVITVTYPGVANLDWTPVVGDWNGDGRDQIGLFNRPNRSFRLYFDLPSTGFTNYGIPATFGAGTLRPVAGDWNFDGKDFVGVHGAGNQTFYLLDAAGPGGPWSHVFTVAGASGLPVAGSWDGESFRYRPPPAAMGSGPRGWPQLISTGGDDYDLYVTGAAEASTTSEALYYNRYSGPHLFTNSGWQLATTPELVGLDGASALGSVFIDSVPVFRHPGGQLYKRLAVMVVEVADPAPMAGWVCLSYSNDNVSWTEPIYATNDPKVDPRPCFNPGNTTHDVLAEQVSGFRDGPGFFFGVMNGNNPEIIDDAMMGTTRTHTNLYVTTVDMPWVFSLVGEFTESGVTTPNLPGLFASNYGINLDFTFDPVEYAVYWARSYAYPFDVDGGIPCGNLGCPSGTRQNPNRSQIYKIDLIPGQTQQQHLERFFNGPWQLVLDTGSSSGYPSQDGGSCATTALNSPFQYALMGVDVNAVTFVKDTHGRVARDGDGKRTLIFSGAAIKDRAIGECAFSERSFYAWREP